MDLHYNNEKYGELRKAYPVFIYNGFTYGSSHDSLWAEFSFELPGAYSFKPRLEIPSKKFIDTIRLDNKALENLLFHIGMVELVSYWKATCSPSIIIRSRKMDAAQITWFKKLYFNGLGEFFYLNGLDPDPDRFVDIITEAEDVPQPFRVKNEDAYIVPVGGGKDSIVTMELLGETKNVRPLIINPRGASMESALMAGFGKDDILEINRSIHPQLMELNEQGFLNGHTPFSALIAFVSLLAAALCGCKNIALSNEASADESTIEGTSINHQYSKTFEFEKDFRDYTAKYITTDINYFSILRPLHEIQIAGLFSRLPQYFGVFKSCNAGSKTDSWCGKCAKCLFTYIILSPFLKPEVIRGIFGHDLFEDHELFEIFDELTGSAKTKPFECVGTVNEVNLALGLTIKQYKGDELPALLKYYSKSPDYKKYVDIDPSSMMNSLNENHFLGSDLLKLIKDRL